MKELLTTINLTAILDYGIIGIVLYFIFSTLKGTRAAQITFGLISLYLFKTIALKYNLTNVSKLLSFIFDNLIIFVLIIFQEEIKHAVNKINNKWSMLIGKNEKQQFAYPEEIVNAVSKLATEKTGALIVLQGEMDIQEHVSGGTKINAEISEELILTIFENYSALHDGALVVQDNKIVSAAAVLPLSKDKNIGYRFGTRHRAALGVSEVSDCLAIVVSEETGKIRISEKGKMVELEGEELKYKILNFYRLQDSSSNKITQFLGHISNVVKKVNKYIEKIKKNKEE